MHSEPLLLPVLFQGEELEFPLRVVHAGFTQRFVVTVADADVIYERDESGELRALLAAPETVAGSAPDAALLAAIGATLAQLID